MLRTRFAGAAACVALLTGCGALQGLTGESTCDEFNAASIDAQRQVIQDLVVAAEDGNSNPMREGNAVMQITYFCQADGMGQKQLKDIAI